MGIFDFIKIIPTVNEMNGSVGEWLAKHYAKVMTDMLVLHDVLIDGADGYTSQMDLLLVGNKGIYVIEVKMFNDAKIYGDGNKTNWYYYKGGRKYDIYSPLKQNKKHIEYLKKLLNNFGAVPCFSILVIICDDFKVTNINKAGEINIVVCNSLPSMKKALYKVAENKPIVFEQLKKEAIFRYIQEQQHIGKEAREQHKKNVIAYKNNMEQMKKEKICPYCQRPLVLQTGKYGTFYGCSNYPKCKYILKDK